VPWSLLTGSSSNITSNASSPTTSSTKNLDAALPYPADLSAPFPVPETDITLLPGSRGTDLGGSEVVLIMRDLMITAWLNVAVRRRVQLVGERTWNVALRGGVAVTLRPQIMGGTSLFTDTDLAETAFGLVYYFMVHQLAFETNITIIRPNESGKRIPIGEIEIRQTQPGVGIGRSRNNGIVAIS